MTLTAPDPQVQRATRGRPASPVGCGSLRVRAWYWPARRGLAKMSFPLYSLPRMPSSDGDDALRALSCDPRELGARLRSLRQSAGLTQVQLARELRTTQSAIARIECGRRRSSLDAINRVAGALGCRVSVLIEQDRVAS
jgi:DNA-binding XRE family transcriptional regulator